MQWLRKRTSWCPSRWTSKWKERPTDAEAIQVLQELGSASTYTGNLRALFKTELEKGARLITTATMDRIEGKGLEKGPLVRATGTARLESPPTPGIWTGATHNRALVSCAPDGKPCHCYIKDTHQGCQEIFSPWFAKFCGARHPLVSPVGNRFGRGYIFEWFRRRCKSTISTLTRLLWMQTCLRRSVSPRLRLGGQT